MIKYNLRQVNQKKGLPLIELVFIICASLFYIDYDIQEQFSYTFTIAAILYFVYTYYREPSCRRPIRYLFFGILLIAVMYQIITEPITVKGNNLGIKYFYSNANQYLLAFFPLTIYYRTRLHATKVQVSIILILLLWAAISFVEIALLVAAENETILHSMNAEALSDAGVGFTGFYFVYAYTFLIITCVILFRRPNRRWIKIPALFIGIYLIYFLSKAQFALSFVTTFISILCLYYVTTKNKNHRILVVCGCVLIICILPMILKYLIIITSDSVLFNARLKEIYAVFVGEDTGDSDMQSRLALYWKCIEAFLNSPIIGNSYLNFNGHSTFLSVFAYLGILGGYIVCKMFYEAYRFVKMNLGDKYIYFIPLMCQIILMGLTNPIISSPSNFLALFFLSPLLLENYSKHPKQ